MRLHLVLIVVTAFPQALVARQWSDATGQYRREAEFLYQQAGTIWLRDASGKTYRVERARLSATDQEFVASLENSTKGTSRTSPFSKGPDPLFRLTSRMPNLVKKSDANVSAASSAAAASLFRLTGWHCDGGHCYATSNYYSHYPQHPTPCPQPEDRGKRIMKGWHSSFHLVSRDRTRDGTGTYEFADAQGCCHQYLELLTLVMHSTNNDWFYKVVDSTPGLNVTDWQFRWIVGTYECYWVFYSSDNGATWMFYDTARGKIVE